MTALAPTRWARADSGQAAVETALVAPLTIFFILGILQLTMMQQARLMLEYAAFNAARAGSVWNLDPAKMERAAIFSLLPTRPTGLGLPLNGLPVMAHQWTKEHVFSPNGNPASAGPAADLVQLTATNEAVYQSNRLGLRFLDVEVLNPRQSDFAGEPEIDFDHVDGRLDLGGYRQATQLTVRLVYFYEMRIPFANWVMFQSWLATKADLGLGGLGTGGFSLKKGAATLLDENSSGLDRTSVSASLADTSSAGYNKVTKAKLMELVGLAATGRYYIPLVTTYTIRMQSNPFRQWARPN